MTQNDMPFQGSPIRSAVELAIGPLVELLRRELELAGIPSPGAEPTSIRTFTLWYLEVVQLLDAHCAEGDQHPAMARAEVELMCRCALSACSLEEAMQLCARYCETLYPRAGRIELRINRNMASFCLDSLRNNPTTASSLVDITGLFAFRQLFQWLVVVDLQLMQVGIGPVEREDVLPFLQLFKAPVLSGGNGYVMEFPADILRLPVIRTSAEFNEFFTVFPCAVFEDTRRTLAEQVVSLLSASLRQGTGIPTQIQLATALGLSLSTFRRRLTESGTSFRDLRESCLQDSAHYWLRHTDMTISDISSRLGFSDAGAFRRAFRQWTGTAPTTWREAHRGTTHQGGSGNRLQMRSISRVPLTGNR